MATGKQLVTLSRSELKTWRAAYNVALGSLLIRASGRKLNPAGAGHIAAEHATTAVLEERRARQGGLS